MTKKLGWECKEVYLFPASIYYGNDYFIAKGPKEELEKLKQAIEEETVVNTTDGSGEKRTKRKFKNV